MKGEIALYEYLYRLIVSQICSGTLRCGQRLPSQPELCLQYNVGITTARKVTRMLEQDGYIKTGKRKRPVVVYEVDTQTYITSLLQRRPVILDILEGFRLILPVLQLGGARQYARPEVLEAIMAGIQEDSRQMELYARASHFMMELLGPYNNQIIYDLQADSENFTHIPYLPVSGLENIYSAAPGTIKKSLSELLKAIQDRDSVRLEAGLYKIYDYGRSQALRYIGALEAHCHEYKETPSPERFMLKNRAHLYTVIARQLHKRILNGEFDDCKYIPSIPELVKEYSISQATAANAVALLNDIGVVRTIAKKGTAPARPGEQLQPLRMDQTTIGKNLVLCLDALQIMALCSKSLSRSILPAMDPSAVLKTVDAWSKLKLCTSGEIIRALLEFFKDNTSYCCLSTLFEQLDYLLIWSHYLERSRLPIKSMEYKMEELFVSLRHSLSIGHTEHFSSYVHSVFRLSFHTARQLMLENGSTPEKLPSALPDEV